MPTITQSLITIYSYCNQYLDDISRPNPKYAKSHVEFQLTHSRLKFGVIFHSFIIVSTLLQMLCTTGQINLSSPAIPVNIFSVMFFVLLRRFHPEVFAISYHLFMLLFISFISRSNEDGFHRVWSLAAVYPNFLFLCTGRFSHFIIQAIIQIGALNITYQEKMRDLITVNSADSLLHSLTTNSTKSVIFNMIIVLCIQNQMQTAYKNVYIAEKARTEFESQKTFILGFSHELRNLLNSLMGNVKLAHFEQLTDKTRELLQNANLCGELLLHLVNNILDTGKAEIGDLEVNPVSTNTCEMLEKIWNVCSDIISRKMLNGTMKISQDLPPMLKIDHYRLTQMMLNLVGNAVKFTDSGSVDIAIGWLNNKTEVDDGCFKGLVLDDDHDEFSEIVTERDRCFSKLNEICLGTSTKRVNPSRLHGGTSIAKGVLRLKISDSGCGISPQNIPKLFQKFSQVSSESSRRMLGTGLGLFITKQICERMNGQIQVYSQENKGSCFVICIPIESVATRAIKTQQFFRSYDFLNSDRLNGLRAMVIDDDNLSSTVLKMFMTKLCMNVTDIAQNGLDGFNKYVYNVNQNLCPQVVIMDIEMPIMDGKQAAECIRKLERERRIKPCLLIIISGNCSASEIKDCLDMNGAIRANAFLKKPTSIEEISCVITEHFRSSRI